MTPTTFADFVIIALAAPCIVLVLSGYGLLAAALFGNLRERYAPERSGARRQAIKG
jgi:hypothetical protein